jgi:hypothetical protein
MCLRRAPEEYIAGAKAPPGAALDRAGLEGIEMSLLHEMFLLEFKIGCERFYVHQLRRTQV